MGNNDGGPACVRPALRCWASLGLSPLSRLSLRLLELADRAQRLIEEAAAETHQQTGYQGVRHHAELLRDAQLVEGRQADGPSKQRTRGEDDGVHGDVTQLVGLPRLGFV